MRVLLGLSALLAAAQAQTVTVSNAFGTTNNGGGTATLNTGVSTYALGPTKIYVTSGSAFGTGSTLPVGASYIPFTGGNVNGVNSISTSTISNTDRVQQQAFLGGTVNGGTSTVYFQFNFNQLVAEVKYQLVSGKSALSTLCDPCSSGCVVSGFGPATNTNNCASLTGRVYTVTLPTGSNQFQVFFYDWEGSNTASNSVTYSFAINRPAIVLVGDPQIVGMQGQDFQVHGMPDEIFNMVSYPSVQVNARFTYLSEAECPDNYTTCFAHPGTYISEQGVRVGKEKVHVVAGPAKKGLTVFVNGKKVHQKKTALKLGSVEIVNHRRVIVKTPIAALTMTNSDKFMNQEISMHDEKLIAIGAERTILKDGETFHPEVPLHGLQGQTWRNVEYPSGLDYEGSIMDYHIPNGNLFGTDFVFNKFNL